MVKSIKKKVRPPRIYTDKKTGRKYIKKDGRKYYLNFGKKADKLESVELLRLFLKHLGKPRARQSKKASGKVIISDFNRLEHENRNQVNNQLDQLRREKYIKIHEAEAAEERAKKKQQQDAQDREEELKRQTARERRLADDLKEEKDRAARARIPYAPRMIDNRPAPRYTDEEIKQGIQMYKEAKRREQKSKEDKKKAEEETKVERAAREEAEEKARKAAEEVKEKAKKASEETNRRNLVTEGLRTKNTTYRVSDFNDAFFNEVKKNKEGIQVPTGKKTTRALINFLMNYPEIPVGTEVTQVQQTIGKWAGMKLEQGGDGASRLNTLTKAELRGLLNKKDWMWKMTKPMLIDILLDKMDDDESLADKVENQIGGGAGEVKEGLMTNDIDNIMKDEKTYAGTIPSDKIANLKIGTLRKYGFIMNTQNSSQPGLHWIAVWVDYDGDKTIEIYDPLAEYEPTQSFLKQIKDIVDNTKNLDHYLLLKVNKVKNQSDSSDTCGWHSARFLMERARGNRYKFASGWTDLKEDKIKQFKKQYGYGYDTYV